MESPVLQSILDNFTMTKVNGYAKERAFKCIHCGTQMLQRAYDRNFHNQLRKHLLEHNLVVLSKKEFEHAARN